MRRAPASGPAAKMRRTVFLLLVCSRLAEAQVLPVSHMLWITVCPDIFGGSLDYLRIAHCSDEEGGAYCDAGDYDWTDESQNPISTTSFSTVVGDPTIISFGLYPEDGFETALIAPGATYGFGYSLDVEPTTLAILKEPGYDALCVEKVGWKRSNSTTIDWSVEGSDLLGNSTLIYLNEPEYTEELSMDGFENTRCGYEDDDDDNTYICDSGQRVACSGGLYVDETTQTESPCVRGWQFFNLQRDADFEYELKIEGCSGSGTSTGASASFCPDPSCNTSDVVEQALADFDGSGTTTFPVKLDFNPVAIRLSASAEEGWCANAMSFNGLTLAGSYPYEMAANESRIVENIQYFVDFAGFEPTAPPTTTTSDGTSLSTYTAWATAMMMSFGGLAILQVMAA